MAKPGLGARLRYAFDKSMAAGPIALIGWLALVSLVIIAIAGAFLALTRIAPEGERAAGLRRGILGIADAHARFGHDGRRHRLGLPHRHAAGDAGRHLRRLGADRRAQRRPRRQARRAAQGPLAGAREATTRSSSTGRRRSSTSSPNWSSPTRAAGGRASSSWPTRTRSRWRTRSPPRCRTLRNTRIICRSGDPTDLYDIAIVNPQTARSIIILSPETATIPISQVIKTILALVNDPGRRAEPYLIAAEIRDGAECRGRPRRRRRGGPAGARRRPDLAHRRPFDAASPG